MALFLFFLFLARRYALVVVGEFVSNRSCFPLPYKITISRIFLAQGLGSCWLKGQTPDLADFH